MLDFTSGWHMLKSWVKVAWAAAPKLTGWTLVGVAAMIALFIFAPQMAGTILYKYAVTTLSIVWLYCLCIHIWPHSRPSSYLDFNDDVKPGKEIPYAAALVGQILFVAICFHGLAQLV